MSFTGYTGTVIID